MNDSILALFREYGLYFAGEDNRDSSGNNYWWGTLVGDMSYYDHYMQWPRPTLLFNTVRSEKEKNGQFRGFLTQMVALCTAQNWNLVVLNVMPPSLETYLTEKWYFSKAPNVPGLVWTYTSAALL
jgi:hypothetical protein